MAAFFTAAGFFFVAFPFAAAAEASLFFVAPPPPPAPRFFSASGLSRSWLMKLPVRLFPLGRREAAAATGAGSSVGEESCCFGDDSDRRSAVAAFALFADGSGDPGACGGVGLFRPLFDLGFPPRATVVVTGGSGTTPTVAAAAVAGLEEEAAAAPFLFLFPWRSPGGTTTPSPRFVNTKKCATDAYPSASA